MKLRQILNQLQSSIGEELTEDQLLDLDIRVKIPHSSASFSTRTGIESCSVEEKKEFSKAEGRVTLVDRWIQLDTNPVT